MQLLNTAPQWIVPNVSETVEYLKNELGFTLDWIGKHPRFAIVHREGFSLMFRQLKKPNLVRPNRFPFLTSGWHTKASEAWDIYIWVNEVERLYDEFMTKEVTFIKDLGITDYGNKDFEIEDCNGCILCFGEVLS